MSFVGTFGVLLFISFLMIVFRGAPFVPTRGRDVEMIFSLYKFKKNDVLVDLGSGDGRVLAAAAARDITSVGYELNPFLVAYSKLKLRSVRHAQVRFEDFWLSALPQDTAVVFVFLANPYMKKLNSKMEREAARLGHDLVLISYGMKIPSKKAETQSGGFVTYRYKP